MNETQILKLCMRISEYNLQANTAFSQNVLFQNIDEHQKIKEERDKLIIAIMHYFPKAKINDVLRKSNYKNIDGTKTINITTNLDEIRIILYEQNNQKNKKDNKFTF